MIHSSPSKPFPTLPSQPQNEEGLVFKEPWEAQVFAMTLKLYEQGIFSWKEWAECLGAAIAAAQNRGESDLGDTYYHHWLAALESIVAKKGVLTPEELHTQKHQWEVAMKHTAHGEPIQLKK